MTTTNEEAVEFCRVCTLNVKDLFLINGVWRKVVSKTKFKIRHKFITPDNAGKTFEIGANSQQFVQVVRAMEEIKIKLDE